MSDRQNKKPLLDVLQEHGLISAANAGKTVFTDFCWNHPDKNTPNMRIDLEKEVFHCHACGHGGDVVTLLMTKNGMTKAEAMNAAYGKMGRKRPRGGALPGSEATYYYKDKDGNICFAVLRKPVLKSNHKMHGAKYLPYRFDEKGWIAGMPQIKYRPLYRLPELLERPLDQTIFIVEGEHCADNLSKALDGKYVVTTWQGGCKAWRRTDWSPMQNRRFAFMSDGDEVGREAAKHICNRLVNEFNCTGLTWLVDGDDGKDCVDMINELGKGPFVKLATKCLIEYNPTELAEEGHGEIAENKENEERLVDNEHFKLMGYQGDNLWFRDRKTQEMIPLPRRGITTQMLSSLAPAGFWTDDKDIKAGSLFKYSAAFNEAAKAMGQLNLDSFLGRGACTTNEDGYIFHLGDRLMDQAGQRIGLDSTKLKRVYAALPPLTWNSPCTGWQDQMIEFRELFTQCHWRSEMDSQLALGWFGSCLAGGALKWRPILWLSAQAGTGKSTVQDFFYHILGREYSQKFDDFSEAGIAEAAGSDALPIFLDEAEPGGLARNIDRLFRISSGETSGERARGRREGGVRKIKPRATYMCASIDLPNMGSPTIQRMLFTKLVKPIFEVKENETAYEVRMHALMQQVDDFIKDSGASVRDGLVLAVPRVIERAAHHVRELIERGVATRQAHLLSGICAGLELFYPEDAVIMKKFYDETSVARDERDADETNIPVEIMLTILSTPLESASLPRKSAFASAASRDADEKRQAAQMGIRYDWFHHELYIDHKNPQLLNLLKRRGYENFSLKSLTLPGLKVVRDRAMRFADRTPKTYLVLTPTALDELGYNKREQEQYDA